MQRLRGASAARRTIVRIGNRLRRWHRRCVFWRGRYFGDSGRGLNAFYGLPCHVWGGRSRRWLGQAVRPGRGVFEVVVAAQIVDVVRHLIGWRQALMRLCRRRFPCLAPSLDHAGDDDPAAVVISYGPQEFRIAPRGQRRVAGESPFIDLLADGVQDIVDWHELQDRLNRRHVVEAGAGRVIPAGSGKQLVAQFPIRGGLLGRGRLPLLLLLGLTRLAILEPADDVQRNPVIGIVRRRSVLLDVPRSWVYLPRFYARHPFFVAVAIAR